MLTMVRMFSRLLVLLLPLLAGCNERPGSRVVARVNGANLTVDDLSFRPEPSHGAPAQARKRTVEDVVKQELLFQQGVRLGLDRDPSFRGRLATLRDQSPAALRVEVARRVFNTEIASQIEVTSAQGEKYYEANAERIGTQLHLGLIRTESKAQAEAILKKLREGASFESQAEEATGSASDRGRRPWDLGFVRWEEIPVEFTDAIYGLNPGEVSTILGSQAAGFQIVKLFGAKRVDRGNYAAVSATVMNRLRDARLLATYNEYVANLKRTAKIETY
jgi:hypothetical protein